MLVGFTRIGARQTKRAGLDRVVCRSEGAVQASPLCDSFDFFDTMKSLSKDFRMRCAHYRKIHWSDLVYMFGIGTEHYYSHLSTDDLIRGHPNPLSGL